jgi:hypothetical protein
MIMFMNNIFCAVLLVLLISCSNTNNSSHDNVNSVSKQEKDTSAEIFHGIPDFLKLVDAKSIGFRGNLQGVENTDSAGPYVCKEYFSDTLSFRLVYVPKYLKKNDITFDSIANAKNNDFEDYVLVSFVYPMKHPDYVGKGDDQIKYPLTVKTYVRKGNKWELVSKSRVNDLTELSQYQIKCIYSALDS